MALFNLSKTLYVIRFALLLINNQLVVSCDIFRKSNFTCIRAVDNCTTCIYYAISSRAIISQIAQF